MVNSRLFAIGIFGLFASMPIPAFAEPHCTLNPTEGTKRIKLDDGIDAEMIWSVCESMVRRIVFAWPLEMGVPDTPEAALSRAAALVSEWERATSKSFSPFVGSVVNALASRAISESPYQFGESIPVSDEELEVVGWDGVWIELGFTTEATQLVVHYWANP